MLFSDVSDTFDLCCRAVVDHSVGKDLPSVFVESFEYFPGRGLTATVNGVKVRHSYLLVLIVCVMCVHLFLSFSSI